jgi:thioredoxin reductase (NADPH)
LLPPKQFRENRIQYTWIDVQQDDQAMAVVERLNDGRRSVPTIVFPDGSILSEPGNDELAEKLGLHSTAQHNFYDLIIVGAGPSGLTTAIYAARWAQHSILERACQVVKLAYSPR